MRISWICVAFALSSASTRADDESMPDDQAKPDWVELASPTPGSNGTEYIPVARDTGKLAKLRIDATGVVFVVRIDITYIGGDTQTVRPEQRVDAQHPATVDVAKPKPIQTVVVTTDRDTHGSYSVYGRTVPPPVARR